VIRPSARSMNSDTRTHLHSGAAEIDRCGAPKFRSKRSKWVKLRYRGSSAPSPLLPQLRTSVSVTSMSQMGADIPPETPQLLTSWAAVTRNMLLDSLRSPCSGARLGSRIAPVIAVKRRLSPSVALRFSVDRFRDLAGAFGEKLNQRALCPIFQCNDSNGS
jgi:hypothetical protein